MKKKPVLLLLLSGVVLHTIFFLAEGGAKVQQGSFLVNIYSSDLSEWYALHKVSAVNDTCL